MQHDKMSQHAIIEWVDFIHTNGEMYQRAYQLEIADQSLVGDIMGEITFKIADHVHDPEYQSKNGDAAYLEPGTEFYSIEGGYEPHCNKGQRGDQRIWHLFERKSKGV